jgi:hypothetical protein
MRRAVDSKPGARRPPGPVNGDGFPSWQRDHGARRLTGKGLGRTNPTADPGAVLAVLVKRFPRLSETFVLNEILQLRALGLPIRVYAVMDPHELHAQPEAEVLRPEVRYLRSGSGWRAWAALITRAVGVALGRPRGTVRGLRYVAPPGRGAGAD